MIENSTNESQPQTGQKSISETPDRVTNVFNRATEWMFQRMINLQRLTRSGLRFPLLILVAAVGQTLYSDAQDTLRFETFPTVILHSWYPEYSPDPVLKRGRSSILFTEWIDVPEFRNDVDLVLRNGNATVHETSKENQFLVTINSLSSSTAEFEIWLDLQGTIVLVLHNSRWVDIRDIFPVKNNRVLCQTVKVRVHRGIFTGS